MDKHRKLFKSVTLNTKEIQSLLDSLLAFNFGLLFSFVSLIHLSLSEAFLNTAKEIITIIVKEENLPITVQSIPPSSVGGIAGVRYKRSLLSSVTSSQGTQKTSTTSLEERKRQGRLLNTN